MPKVITEDKFGKTKSGQDVTRYTLTSDSGGLMVRILEYGGAISEVHVPDSSGKLADITLGFDDITGYESYDLYFGALVGRVANRVACGKFTLDGQIYNVSINNGPNSNHGGKVGFDKKMWTGKVDGDKLLMTYVSPDGEMGYPGELTTTVTYSVTDNNELSIQFAATTTKPTPVNLSNHAYFNLAGHASGKLDDHVVTVHADSYTPLDATSVPTGEIKKVAGTVYDLTKAVRLGDRIPLLPGGTGFDNNYCLPACGEKPQLAARADHPPTGRYMECYTTHPGVQVYSSFYVDTSVGKKGAEAGYKQYSALCFEGQNYPDSINQPSFPNAVLRPGETYNHTTIYKFGVAQLDSSI